MAAITWETIKSYFTDMDVEHMKDVSEQQNWPQKLDLHNEQDVLYYAPQISAAVTSGSMPIGEPRWPPEKCADFDTWWHANDKDAAAKRIG